MRPTIRIVPLDGEYALTLFGKLGAHWYQVSGVVSRFELSRALAPRSKVRAIVEYLFRHWHRTVAS